jgi:hypothetical protein
MTMSDPNMPPASERPNPTHPVAWTATANWIQGFAPVVLDKAVASAAASSWIAQNTAAPSFVFEDVGKKKLRS